MGGFGGLRIRHVGLGGGLSPAVSGENGYVASLTRRWAELARLPVGFIKDPFMGLGP
jgi:hypothetical protein